MPLAQPSAQSFLQKQVQLEGITPEQAHPQHEDHQNWQQSICLGLSECRALAVVCNYEHLYYQQQIQPLIHSYEGKLKRKALTLRYVFLGCF